MQNVFLHDQTVKTRRNLFFACGFGLFFALTHGDFDSLRLFGNEFRIDRTPLTAVIAVAILFLLVRFLIMAWDDFKTFQESESLEFVREQISDVQKEIARPEKISVGGGGLTPAGVMTEHRQRRRDDLRAMQHQLGQVKSRQTTRRYIGLAADSVPSVALSGFVLFMLYV